MVKILLLTRTRKTEGDIRVRFRLCDGRLVDLFHKSDIIASLADLAKFDGSGTLRKGIRIYNADLKDKISSEIALMNSAYKLMKDSGYDMTSEVFESVILRLKNPASASRKEGDTLINLFQQYADDALRDRIIGKPRYNHFIVVLGKLTRFLTIRGMSRLTPSEFTPALLMDFRNFVFDEYLYVDNYEHLYKDCKKQNIPSQRLSLNTVSGQMKILQTFFSEQVGVKIEKSPFDQLSRERKKTVTKTKYDEPYYLRSDEVKKVMEGEVPPNLKSTRDAFLLQCALGCRIGDFRSLTMKNLSVSEDGIPYVHYLPQKTKDEQSDNHEIKTPLVRFAFDIAVRTRFNFPETRYVSGKSGYNAKIKELLTCCGLSRKVAVYDETKGENSYVPISQMGSSKLCRKTHVDMLTKVQVNMYAAGLHKEGSSAVKRYTNLEMKDRFVLMNAAFGQEEYKVDENLNII